MHLSRLLDLLHRLLPLLLCLVHLCGNRIFFAGALCGSGVYCGVERQVRTVCKDELVERYLDRPRRREIGVQDRQGELLSGGFADLRDVPFHPRAERENEMIEGVDRLHEMSLKRLAHTFYADLAVECD